ncbi:MAG: NAD(P)/FAD-dependent oxidoreductase [Anaerolineae bacterium]|nr:NAD(P)/FAD-dependent oxidoreductase [Anaerolineae bacterium]
MVARFLSRYDLKILWLEQAGDVCAGATAANSAIVHGGYDTIPGTLKAEMNARGNPMWEALSAELHFPFERTGTYVVAVGKEEFAALEDLKSRGERNGIPVEIISGEEMRRREPSIHPDTSGALYCPVGGLCDPWAAAIAAAENAVSNGVELLLETAFLDFIWVEEPGAKPRIMGVKTTRGDFQARWVINAAGVHADEVMHKIGVGADFKIKARRGEYFVLDRAHVQLNSVLFPVPSKVSKGILVTTTLHGNVLLGPNAQDVDEKADTDVTAGGMDEVWAGAQKLVPGLRQRDVIAVFAGLRPGGNAPCKNPAVDYHKDFIIEVAGEVVGLINLAGIESPGLTAAPAIAERTVELLRAAGEDLREKPGWNPVRVAPPVFRHLSREEQAALVAQDPRYGRVICRCECVTEGEIVAAIHAPIPATTYDAIKRRTWLGTGRCLGGFDMPRVVEILARELGVSPLAIGKKGEGSEFLFRETKATGIESEAAS